MTLSGTAPGTAPGTLPEGWALSASAFNLTPALVAAEESAPDLALSLVRRGIARDVEVELGQLWRSFPRPGREEAEALRADLARHGGRVSIVGVSIDDWADSRRRRTDEERFAFLEPQLRAAAALGAAAVRLPIGQAGPVLLPRLVPLLHELDLVLFEEVQGGQAPDHPAHAPAYALISDLDDPRVRVLLDISMLMPALPVTYLAELSRAGLPADLLRRLEDQWRDPGTDAAVRDLLVSGGVPARVHTLYMDLLVRFGRSDVTDLDAVLPLVGAVHLKFWDLDDSGGRVSEPLRTVASALHRNGFTGTLCSEWGGHEWLDADPWEVTRSHLDLAGAALAWGAADRGARV
ncbi:restriction endonuclease subunit R [Kineococcus sp. SYSU DK002]|uniref:restriction endonuclease subunit R n=1 Tax=Kineococcus sp. SYSU DK002 TaxID=3383123 RepID=UPI003D7D443A